MHLQLLITNEAAVDESDYFLSKALTLKKRILRFLRFREHLSFRKKVEEKSKDWVIFPTGRKIEGATVEWSIRFNFPFAFTAIDCTHSPLVNQLCTVKIMLTERVSAAKPHVMGGKFSQALMPNATRRRKGHNIEIFQPNSKMFSLLQNPILVALR